jgi:biopolymer transport protein ExbB/biopolymer transport protein TolQ
MFQNLTLQQALLKGGPVFFILCLLSVFSIAVIIDRAIKLNAVRKNSRKLMDQVMSRAKAGGISEALQLCRDDSGPAAAVFIALLERKDRSRDIIDEAIQREGARFSHYLERHMYILATAGSATPFIGLFGTVLGIISAFRSLSVSESFSTSLVSNGIAEALVNTAAGLFVAVPAVIAYNFFTTRIQGMIHEVEIFCSELTEILMERQAG